jgi:ribosomal protein S18 acetylase RimI-like enzyme
MATAAQSVTGDTEIRRTLRDGDTRAISDLHRRVYASEYGLNEAFVDSVQQGLDAAVARGWPAQDGAVWLPERGATLLGALGLTDEGDGLGRVRWFVLDPELRGRGLGRLLVAQLLDEARAAGLRQLELATFSRLTAAARIYRDAGFRVTWEREQEDWGPAVTFQGYVLEL